MRLSQKRVTLVKLPHFFPDIFPHFAEELKSGRDACYEEEVGTFFLSEMVSD